MNNSRATTPATMFSIEMFLLKFFAKMDVERADDKECDHNSGKNQILHVRTINLNPMWA